MKKHKYIAILIPILGLVACSKPEEQKEVEVEYITPEIYVSKVDKFFSNEYDFRDHGLINCYGCETTTAGLKNDNGYCDYTGNIRNCLRQIKSYEKKDKPQENDSNYFVYQFYAGGIYGNRHKMTVYDNGYIDIWGIDEYYRTSEFSYYIEPKLAKSIHASVDEEIKAYCAKIKEENDFADTILDLSNLFPFIEDTIGMISWYDKNKHVYSSEYALNNSESCVDFLKGFEYTNPSVYPTTYPYTAKFSLKFQKRKRLVLYEFYESMDMVRLHYSYTDELGVSYSDNIFYKISKEDGQKIYNYLLDEYKSHIN